MSQQAEDRIKFMRRLRAVREYTQEPVSDEALEDVLEVARWSGSASNRQPSELLVIKDAATRRLIAENGAGPVANAPLAILVLTPVDPERADLLAFDNGRLVERMLLAAEAHGLGSNVMT